MLKQPHHCEETSKDMFLEEGKKKTTGRGRCQSPTHDPSKEPHLPSIIHLEFLYKIWTEMCGHVIANAILPGCIIWNYLESHNSQHQL